MRTAGSKEVMTGTGTIPKDVDARGLVMGAPGLREADGITEIGMSVAVLEGAKDNAVLVLNGTTGVGLSVAVFRYVRRGGVNCTVRGYARY